MRATPRPLITGQRIAVLGLLLCALAAGAATPARAQGMQSPAQWYINQQIYSTRVFNGVIANSMIDAARGKPGAATAGSGAGSGAAAPVDVTRFTPGPASLAPARLAARAGGDAATRGAAQAAYESQLGLYARTARHDGLPANDLAYAYLYFTVNAFHVYHDLVDVPTDRDPYLRAARDGFERIELAARKRQQQVSPAQERALYEQFRQQLGASEDVRRMSDADKQEAAETLAISFGIAYEAYLRAIDGGDEALRQEARGAARQGLEKLLGRPVERIRIGYGGLEP